MHDTETLYVDQKRTNLPMKINIGMQNRLGLKKSQGEKQKQFYTSQILKTMILRCVVEWADLGKVGRNITD